MGDQGTRPSLVSPRRVLELLEQADVRPRRSMGQNFLIDSNILAIIVKAARLEPTDTIIEVGAGLGGLTQQLLASCRKVYALESDPRLIRVLEKVLGYAKNLVLIEADAARFDFHGLMAGEPPEVVKMVANLPYRIAANLLVDCLNRYQFIREYTIMVQREVADRMTSAPGVKDYSAATVKIGYRASVTRVARVSRNCFYPHPRVDSTLVHLERFPCGEPAPRAIDESFFDTMVTVAFQQRRKKLANSLSYSNKISIGKDQVQSSLATMEKNVNCRAEEIAPGEFVELSNLLCERQGR